VHKSVFLANRNLIFESALGLTIIHKLKGKNSEQLFINELVIQTYLSGCEAEAQ